jgi:ubiquitin-conjugating enzyme E2 variant
MPPLRFPDSAVPNSSRLSTPVHHDYSRTHRAIEITAIIVFATLAATLTWRLATRTDASHLWLIGAAAFAGYLAADLLSGLAHWAFDTFGTVDTPLVGPAFIRPFREHHDDPMSITRHDFIETNGNTALATVPVLVGAYFISPDSDSGVFAMAFVLAMSLALFATNQFHKWAHMSDPGDIVRRLQRWRLILPSEHHSVHHRAPYETQYCITTGWMNGVLAWIGFFRRAERVIRGLAGGDGGIRKA